MSDGSRPWCARRSRASVLMAAMPGPVCALVPLTVVFSICIACSCDEMASTLSSRSAMRDEEGTAAESAASVAKMLKRSM